ncbi:SGNH/GDSL hydrolase family protein [Mariniplasma anaerobium]|uniref:Lipase n=1 Tax=Mariniplasma anaerobium TaxID=2735436 RepID=A0A7U9THZ5_9MOLU|nr:GDSL-type esterase/lipase family protein [Mariniplasma anaerobium]BCR36845.1 lipase [Mariniplasma anaerobium]
MKNYLFFGDSVTEAGRDKSNPSDLGHGFVYFLSQEFREIKFINKGIGGQRVKDLINRLDIDVINLNPNVCFILIGVNDAWLPYRLNQGSSIHTFRNSLDVLIKTIIEKSDHTEIVLIKPYAIAIQKSNENMIIDLAAFRNDYDLIGKKYNLPVIDIKETIEKQLKVVPADTLFYDGIHPTKLGHQIIGKIIEDYIRGNLHDL